MEYGSVPGLSTPTDFADAARNFGATEVTVEENHEKHLTRLKVAGMTTNSRRHLRDYVQQQKPAGSQVVVESTDGDVDVMHETEEDGVRIVVTQDHRLLVGGHDITEQYLEQPIDTALLYEVRHRVAAGDLPPEDDSPRRGPLTDVEFFTVLQAMPDDWDGEGDIQVSDIDIEKLKPLMDEYGGLQPLLQAVAESAAKTPLSASEDEDEQFPSWDEETSSEGAEERTEDKVEEAKQAYVDGDIGMVEFESRLEDAIEPPEDLTADTL